MGIITFNGSSSEGIFVVEHPPEYEIPEREYEIVPVPGRNGDLVFDKGSYKNVDRSYDIAVGKIGGDYTTLVNPISKWLHSTSGYARLEDSYEPDYYKLAMYSEKKSFSNIYQQAGRATITFNRKPQRFLKSGDTKITNPTSIINPTTFDSSPIITVRGTGNGVLHIGAFIITITNIINFITLNSEIGDAYNGLINLNDYIVLSNGFPKLVPGSNTISFSGGITSVEIIPKWWTI